jgi:hypothetical protein
VSTSARRRRPIARCRHDRRSSGSTSGIGASVEAALDDAAAWVRAAEARLDGVQSISVGLDRTTVPMAEVIPGAPIPEPRIRMRYASRRRAGLPIGSVATEGACKSLVTVRFKRSGQRWLESGVASCLSLRALHLSERLGSAFGRVAAAREATM